MPNRAYQNRGMVDINSEKSYRSEELVNSFSREIFSKLKLESSEWNCIRFRPKLTQYDVVKTDCVLLMNKQAACKYLFGVKQIASLM